MRKFLILVLLMLLAVSATVQATPGPAFSVSSLTANYYLDRDTSGVSTLAAEEVFNVQFPSGGSSFSGFNRSLPTDYLKNNNALKVSSVTDELGQSISYRTAFDASHNLIINIGDPSITVYGSHTYFIRYQAKGVINILSDKQQFYPNFNGRGWSVPFPSISGVVHLSPALAKQLLGPPRCLIDSGRCRIQVQKKSNEEVIILNSLNGVPPHQSLTAKIDFKPGTFKPYKAPNKTLKYGLYVLAGLIGLATVIKVAEVSRRAMLKMSKRDKK